MVVYDLSLSKVIINILISLNTDIVIINTLIRQKVTKKIQIYKNRQFLLFFG